MAEHMHTFSFYSMSRNMSLRKDPTQGAAENLRLKMEQQESEDANNSSKGSGLSAGATAGITIGVTLGVGILVIAIFVWRRRQNSPINVEQSGYQTFSNS